ncbi:MAG: hypothetical protein R3B81_05100 [bacterium]
MPVLEVRALTQHPPIDVPAVLADLCTAVAEADGCPAHQVWATWHALRDGFYVEGTRTATVQPRETHPPLVRVMASAGRDPDRVAAILRAAAGSLSKSLSLDPGNVFVHYEELPAGQVWSNGDLIR